MGDDNTAEPYAHSEMSGTPRCSRTASCGETLQTEAEYETAVSFTSLETTDDFRASAVLHARI